MARRSRPKNVFCRNTKLSEKAFSQVVWGYCGFISASKCAVSAGCSRQTVQGLYTKLGERLTEMFEQNDFPNFSGSVAIEMMDDEHVLRWLLSLWIQPKYYDLALFDEDEALPANHTKQNLVAIRRSSEGKFSGRIFDHNGDSIDYRNIPEALINEIGIVFTPSYRDLELERKMTKELMGKLNYTQPDIRMYDDHLPKFDYHAYLNYRDNGVVLDPDKGSTVYHSRYRVLKAMIATEKVLRGFSKEKYWHYLSRARLMELMLFSCLWARRKRGLLKDKRITLYARDAAYILIMLSLRYRPL